MTCRAACIVVLLTSGTILAEEKPLSVDELEKAAKFIVAGRVERVYTSERKISDTQTDTLYAIELNVTKVLKVEGDAAGRVIFIKAWKATTRPANFKGDKGQIDIPGRGDLIEAYITGGPAAFEAIVPNGIQIKARGTSKSQTLGMEFALIHPGEFRMGSPGEEPYRRADETEHRVKLTKAWYMGVHEVTQEDYEKLMGANPSHFSKNGAGSAKVNGLDTKRFPVEMTSWFDAAEFCNRLSVKDGYEPYYKLADVKKNGVTITEAAVTIAGGNGYRLPSEAEWEFACRAGTTTPFHYGKESSEHTANVKALLDTGGYGASPKWKELGRTTKVGSYPANAWGLFDMHGNAAEWCEDWYDKGYYTVSPRENPRGPEMGAHRAIRGGSWLVNDAICRSACRFFHLPSEATSYSGFRLARTP
ncbi:MAG: formylglycine-generating enzyme family protein [Gemmataceae bacterium]